MRKIFVSCVVFLMAVTLALTASQSKSGTILVVVTDVTKAVLPGVQLTLSNAKTEAVVKSQTDASGEGRFNVPAGTYAVTAVLRGFENGSAMNIQLGEDQTVRVDLNLKLGTRGNAILIGK